MKNDLRALKPGDTVVLVPHSNSRRSGVGKDLRVVGKVGRTLLHLVSRYPERGWSLDDGRERSDWPSYVRTVAYDEYITERNEVASELELLTTRGYSWTSRLSTEQMQRIIAVLKEPGQ